MQYVCRIKAGVLFDQSAASHLQAAPDTHPSHPLITLPLLPVAWSQLPVTQRHFSQPRVQFFFLRSLFLGNLSPQFALTFCPPRVYFLSLSVTFHKRWRLSSLATGGQRRVLPVPARTLDPGLLLQDLPARPDLERNAARVHPYAEPPPPPPPS